MDYARARINMVDNQLRPNRIEDPRLLDAMREVPRERFLPKLLRGVAYADEDLLLPGGGHLIEPLVLARLIQAAQDPAARRGPGGRLHDRLRGRGAGPAGGDRDPAAARPAAIAADRDACSRSSRSTTWWSRRATIRAAGHPSQAPFDVILLVGSVEVVPPALLEQIGEGGRLVAVVDDGRIGKGTLFTRLHGVIGRQVAVRCADPAPARSGAARGVRVLTPAGRSGDDPPWRRWQPLPLEIAPAELARLRAGAAPLRAARRARALGARDLRLRRGDPPAARRARRARARAAARPAAGRGLPHRPPLAAGDPASASAGLRAARSICAAASRPTRSRSTRRMARY